MRLSLKLSVFTALGILVVLGCDGYFRIQRELRLFTDQQQHDHRELARVLALAASAASDRAGPRRALQLLRDVNLRDDDIDIRWIPDPLRGVTRTTSSILVDGASQRRTLVTRKPLVLDQPGQLVLRQSLYRSDQYMSDTALGALRVSAVLVALSTAIIFAVGWWQLGVPLRLLVASARRIGFGKLETRLQIRRNDEIGDLAHEMNLMCRQLAASRELAVEEATQRARALERMTRVEQWTTLGKLAAGLSQALGSRAEEIRRRCAEVTAGPEVMVPRDQLDAIAQNARQLAEALDRVRMYADSATAVRDTQDLQLIVRTAIDLVALAGRQERVQIQFEEDPEPVLLEARAPQLQQLVVNLLLNAIQSQPGGGRIRIGAHRDCRPFVPAGLRIGPSGFVCLLVEDEGPGMDETTRDRMFEPMFTTREASHATGFGLTAVAAIVAEQRGFIDVRSEPGRGTRVAVFLSQRC